MTIEQSSNETTNQQERQLELAWLAGIWEGEGTFVLFYGSKNRITPRASVINTDFVLIDGIISLLKRNNIAHYVQTRRGGCDGDPRHKDAKVIVISGYKRIENFIKLILPHFRGKKRAVAEYVLGFVSRRLFLGPRARYTDADFEAVEAVRALNKKGPIESSETTRQPLSQTGEDIVQAVLSV